MKIKRWLLTKTAVCVLLSVCFVSLGVGWGVGITRAATALATTARIRRAAARSRTDSVPCCPLSS